MSYGHAYRDGRSEYILLQPVSISFDQLQRDRRYAEYARGARIPRGHCWLYNFIKAHGERNYGQIYVLFPRSGVRCRSTSARRTVR